MKQSFVVFFVLLLLGVGVKIFFKIPAAPLYTAPSIKASRELPKNHQLAADDLDLSGMDTSRPSIKDSIRSYVGYHLLTDKTKGQVMAGNELGVGPVVPGLSADSGTLAIPLREDELPLQRLTDAGDRLVFVYPRDSVRTGKPICCHLPVPCKMELAVVAVHRATAGLAGNWILVKVPLLNMAEMVRWAPSKERYILLTGRR
jgi:hypothetical protein